MIQIKRNNKVFFTLEDFGEGSKLSYQLMDHHYIILKFTTATPIYFEIGDSVEIPDFGYFELTSSYFPKHNDSDGYDYEMQMDAYYMSWKNKLCKYRPQHGANETSFNLTTTVGVHMNVILGNLKALGLTYNGKDFSVDYTTYNNKAFDVQKRFLIEYGSISILDALNAICSEDALNCEWWIDGSIIYLGYCEMEGQTIFEQDVNVLSMSYSESKSTYITRLYAFGSDRNIPKGYFTGADADVTTDGVATDYLMLPNKEVDSDGFYAKDGYLENVNVVKNDKQAIEGVVMFEEEYPKVESVVSSIKTYDSTVDNEDGTKTTQTFWQVTSTDSFTNSFKESWIKSNLTLGIKFTSGALMGMEFDVSFKVIDKVNYFEIVANDTYGRTLPDGVMCPKVGDKYFLFNWDATKITDTNLIPTAQLSLFDRAKQYYQKTMISNSNFTCTMDGDKFYNDGIYDYHPLGEQVKLINDMFAQVDADGKHYRNSRIIGMEIPLDIPYDHPQYIVGEKAATSRLGKLEDKVDSIKVNGMQIGGTGSGNGGGVYVIGLNDTTPASDSNVYSARRSRMEFIHRLTDDTAKGTVTWEKVQKFLQGLAIGESGKHYIDKNGGASLSDVVVDRIHDAASTPSDRVIIGAQGFDLYMGDDGKSHMYLDNIVVRQKFFASSAEIRKISYSGGTTIFSNAGSTLAKVSVIFDADGNCIGYKCYACADDGTTRTMNWWRIGMMALCQTFNVKAGKNEKLQNRYYWRLVVGVGQEILDDGKLYDYVVLSNKEKFLGSESIVPTYANKLVTADGTNMLVFGDYGIEVSAAESMGSMAGILMKLEDKETDEGGNLIANRYFYGYESGIAQDAPAEGDVIVQVGDQICWKSRGNLIKISTSTEDNATDNAPAITMYHNLGALYSTGKKDSAGMEIISPYQWKTCTCVISPEQVKFNANNFMWFTEDPEKPFSPITVFYNIETNGMFRVGSSGRLYGDNVENGTAKVSVCCYKVMGDTKDVLDECWWESSCQDIKIDSPYTGRTDLQTNDAAAQNLPAYFTLDCYTLSVTADGTKHRGDVLLATMDIPVLKDGDKGEKGDKGDKGEQGEQGLRGLQGETGEQGIPGTPGKDGKTTYFHIKYSSEANPTTAAQMTETPNTYIGTYVDFLPNDSTDPNVYTWSRFEGLQGKDGTNGIPGKNGADGRTSYLHIKYSNDGGQTLTVNDGETPGSWIGQYTDYEQKDSTNVTKYTWSKIKGEQGDKGEKGDKGDKGEQGEQGLRGLQGETGEQGIPGTPGKDGKTTYFHIKYSSEANPTTAAQMTETPNTYIGTYVDFLPNDSTDPNVYTWSRFEGLQGKDGTNGIPGKNGADGRTSYLHIKYSNDGGQTLTVNDGETPGSWIGQYTDYEQKDSTNVTKYTWSKIKGEQGDKGEKGDPGVAGVSPVTYTVDFLLQEKKVYIYVHKIQEKTNITHLISKWNNTLTCNVYINGEHLAYKDSDVMSDSYIDLLAFPSAKTIDIILKQKDGDEQLAIGNYTIGSEFEYQIIPEVVIFDTNDEGKLLTPKQSAEIKCYRNGQDVTNNCGFSLTNNHHLNCTPGPGQKKNMVIIQNITNVTVDGITMPAQNGYAQVQITDEHGGLHYAYVKFQVNITKFVAHVYSNNKTLTSQYSEISGKVNDMSGKLDGLPTGNELKEWKSSIIQTAREISLSVSEKSVGRRNMLVGSAFRKYGDGFMYMSGGYYDGYPLEQIEKNSGIDGVNCIHCRTKQTGTNEYYLSGFRWNGISPQGNIKLEKGKNYVLSFYAKTHTPNDIYFHAEVLYQGSKIDTSRPAGYAGPTGYSTTFSASEADKWELFTVKVSVPPDALYEYVEINIFGRARSYSFVGGYICKPMLEEGENYNGWTLSEQDYDYVGGNLLDNARTLDKSGTLIETYDTVIQNGYGTDSACIKNLMKANATLSDYKEVLRWSFGSTYLVNGNDYIFSFVAKADVDDARVVCYMWSGDINISSDIFTEGNGGAWDSKEDGNIVFILSRQWTRYWVHWRPKDGYATPKEVIIRHTGNNSTSASTVYVTQPKLEIGATMTEWTERKTDLVDKASLKKAGIEITSDQVTLYGNKVQVKTPKANPSEGYDEAAMFQNGKLNAKFINAGDVVAKGINAQEITATKLNVTGDSKIGIWSIKKDDNWGDIMQAEGTEYNGATVVSGIQYCPLFVRGGSLLTDYFRVGTSCTEFSYQSSVDHFNAVWFGMAARTVCNGSNNKMNLPTNYAYNTQYEPVQYIYSEQSKKDSPALAINVIAKGFTGTPTALQTNGAIQGVIAPNLRIMNYSGQISSSDCIVIVTKGGITLKLPAGPVVGQTLLIYSKVSSKVYIEYDSSGGYGTGKMYSDGSLQTKIEIGRAGTFTYFIFDGENWCYAYFNGSHRNA